MLPSRVMLAVLCAFGVMEIYMTRTNLSIAIVAMVQTVTSHHNPSSESLKIPYCQRNGSAVSEESSGSNLTSLLLENGDDQQNVIQDTEGPQIKMTSTQRGNILSAFYYAYGLTSMTGGRLSEVYGTKRVFGAALLINAIGNFVTPMAAKTRYELLFVVRFVIGLFQGGCYPSLQNVASNWVSQGEVSRFIGFVFMANCIGTVFTMTVCGFLISEIGWEYTFYVCGLISLVFLIIWVLAMYDTPEEHPRISAQEKSYIKKNRAKRVDKQSNKQFKNIPWLPILKSVPLWAVNIAHAGNMFGLGVALTQIPIYLGSIIGLDIKNNGLLSSLPFLARFLGSNFISWIVSFLTRKIHLHPNTWKIILTLIGFGGAAVSFLLVGYSGCNAFAAVALFMTGMALNGSSSCGYLSNYLELAPNYSGTIFGLSTSFAFLFAMLGPVTVGILTPEETSEEWINALWVISAVYVISGVIYCIFLSTDEQPWNNTESKQLRVFVEGNNTLNASLSEDDQQQLENRV